MATKEEFDDAAKRVNDLPKRPSDATLLELYGLYKQATSGDVSGKRPGFIDVRGRAKWDAWKKRAGMSTDEAQDAYVKLVEKLERG